MEYYITDAVSKKLRPKHVVREHEVVECFRNRKAAYIYDSRPSHKTDPPTLWFIASTKSGRLLKVVFIQLTSGDAVIKSAYGPNAEEIKYFESNSRL